VSVSSPLIGTKFYRPQSRPGLVARPRLDERLDRGAEGRLTLVSAPVGFGKTTVLAAWLDRDGGRGRDGDGPAVGPAVGRPVAWLSLDARDSRPATFWAYLVAALQSVVPEVGAGVLPLLQTGQVPTEAVLTTVLNQLAALPDGVTLVLDDYHLADGPVIAEGMGYVLEHLPPQVHLVISTRADPGLPLSRLRARGELVEVRAADLRFTPEEASAYLAAATGLALSADAVTTLEARTEGWIAALQLAALSLRGRPDVDAFVATFAGEDRYIVDYLVDEVLARQPEHLRTFLLRTSVLDRLSGPLCDAVTGGDGGRATLDGLDRANLFVLPLDDHRRWYRYHHLFADVLQLHLRDERPDEVAQLHARASRWYERAGEPVPAVRHALSAGDVDRAAALVELAVPALRRDRQEGTIRGWLHDLPDDVVARRPVLAIGFIGALMAGNEFADVPRRLAEVERRLPRPGGPDVEGMVVVDTASWERLPGAVELYRAALALLGGDVGGTLRHADLALGRAAPGDDVTLAAASALAGLAHWSLGDLDAAHRGYAASVVGLRRAGHLSDVLGCTITLADLRLVQGRLRDAQATYADAARVSTPPGGPPLRGAADMQVGLSQVALERGDVAAAREHLERAQALGERFGLPQYPYRVRAAGAALREAAGDLAGAVALLDDAQRVYVGDFSPDVRPLAALRARLAVRQGRLDEAEAWARARGVALSDDLSYARECEHLTLARLRLAGSAASAGPRRPAEVEAFVARLLAAATDGGRTGSVLEALVLLALTRQARGDRAGAVAALERALVAAEPEGFAWVVVREGPALVPLLDVVAGRGPLRPYARRLLALARPGDAAVDVVRTAGRPVGELVSPLSAREVDVLRLLATDLGGPEIARHLVVSLNTVRTHTKSIYAKLGVSSRRAALSRARELGLLPSARGR